MRYILLLLSLTLIPSTLLAYKTPVYMNPCDSLTTILSFEGNKSAQAIALNSFNALKSYTMREGERIEVSQLNDSTIVASVIIKIHRIRPSLNQVYGAYSIPSNSDGFVSFKIFVQTKQGRARIEFTELLHYGCRKTYGKLCELNYSTDVTQGLQFMTLKRTKEFVTLILKANSLSDW